MEKKIVNLLYKELSYEIQGIAFEVRKNFGPGHKEVIYQKAFEEELKSRNISYEKEKAIKIFSPKTGNFIGLYRPDFLVDGKVIVELKSQTFLPQTEQTKIYDYLRNSQYELGYLINFGSKRLYTKRTIFTNDKKPALKFLVFISLAIVLFSGLWTTVKAAGFDFVQSQPAYINKSFSVDVVLKGLTEPVNTVNGEIDYDPKEMEVKDVLTKGSIVSLWLVDPANSLKQQTGRVDFSGLVPGGSLSGKVFSLLVTTKTSTADLKSLNGKVYLNDGKGTVVNLEDSFLNITAVNSSSTEAESTQLKAVIDNTPPLPFNIEVGRSEKIFNNQWFVVFNTQDQDSGLDYYEVVESSKKLENFDRVIWEKTKSPYVLKDQTRQSYVYVRAIDKAGNSTDAVLNPSEKNLAKTKFFGIIISIILVIFSFIVFLFLKLKPKNI